MTNPVAVAKSDEGRFLVSQDGSRDAKALAAIYDPAKQTLSHPELPLAAFYKWVDWQPLAPGEPVVINVPTPPGAERG